jgi:hypothetical protein
MVWGGARACARERERERERQRERERERERARELSAGPASLADVVQRVHLLSSPGASKAKRTSDLN